MFLHSLILSAVCHQFSDYILKERKKSFWNNYYDEQCVWVTDNLMVSMHINATTAPINVVEIGTSWGGNADFMGKYFKNANIYAVDPLAPDYDPTDAQSQKMNSMKGSDPKEAGRTWAHALILDQHRVAGSGCRYHLIKEFSNAAAPILSKALGKHSIHFLFVDGLHTHEGVVEDIKNYLPLVAAGGVIIFNDYGGRFTGVTRYVIVGCVIKVKYS